MTSRYQKKALFAIQQAIARGLDRFLLEMATGTGKTLVAAAIIRLFLRTGNALRVLFLVDRLELEDQALKTFKKVLGNDYQTVIYKENRDDWRSSEIVVTTVQSLLFNNKYQQLFSPTDFDLYQYLGGDILSTLQEVAIGPEGMKIDRMFYAKFEDTVRENDFIAASVEAGQWDRVIDYVNQHVFNHPAEFYTLDKLRQAAAVDRRLTLREILEKIFGLIPRFKLKDELLEEEFAKFVTDYKPQEAEAIPAIKTYFKAYVTDGRIRHIIDHKEYADLATNPVFSMKDFKAVPDKYRALIPDYIKDYVSLNQFAA